MATKSHRRPTLEKGTVRKVRGKSSSSSSAINAEVAADAQTRCFPNWVDKRPFQLLGVLLRRIHDPRGHRIPR